MLGKIIKYSVEFMDIMMEGFFSGKAILNPYIFVFNERYANTFQSKLKFTDPAVPPQLRAWASKILNSSKERKRLRQ